MNVCSRAADVHLETQPNLYRTLCLTYLLRQLVEHYGKETGSLGGDLLDRVTVGVLQKRAAHFRRPSSGAAAGSAARTPSEAVGGRSTPTTPRPHTSSGATPRSALTAGFATPRSAGDSAAGGSSGSEPLQLDDQNDAAPTFYSVPHYLTTKYLYESHLHLQTDYEVCCDRKMLARSALIKCLV
jgi:hypothetical protein